MRCEGEFGLGFKGSSVFFFRFEWESFQNRVDSLYSFLLKRGNSKSDNSLKRLRIELKSKRTIEKTTRH